MPDDAQLEKDLQRLSIDFEKATPLAEWDYREVDFPGGGTQVSIKHKIRNQGRIIFLAVTWRLAAGTIQVPNLYVLLGEQYQFDGYIKVRSTAPGQATVLVGLRRDG